MHAEHSQISLEKAEVIKRAIARRIGNAKIDPKSFFEFVVREETSRSSVRCLPHQRVMFDFIVRYPRCLLRMPVGSSKTYTLAAYTMFLLGRDCTQRGAIISSTQDQAKKPLNMVRDYIETSAELAVVFPNLKPSSRSGDPWTQTALTVERPPGIRDPSLKAVGVGGALPGSRLGWMVIDDILNEENTATPEQRAYVHQWLLSSVISRRDVKNARIVVANTPWHSDDVTYRLEKAGWPSLTMDIEGGIYFKNADDFDSDDIRPSLCSSDPRQEHRLTAHDTETHCRALYEVRVDGVANDVEEEPDSGVHRIAAANDGKVAWVDRDDLVPLWPEKFDREHIEDIKATYAGALYQFNKLYMSLCRDDESTEGVKEAWIKACKAAAREQGHFRLVTQWDRNWPTFTGVDLAIGKKKKHGWRTIFTFAMTPEGKRLPIGAEFGKWTGKTIVQKVIETHNRYGSIIAIENNAAQDYLRQWALDEAATLPLRAHTTGKNKVDPHHGIKSMFVEVENTAWLLPAEVSDKCPPGVQMFIDDMLNYDPDGHTGDMLMAAWFARELARKLGFMRKGAVNAWINQRKQGGSVVAALEK